MSPRAEETEQLHVASAAPRWRLFAGQNEANARRRLEISQVADHAEILGGWRPFTRLTRAAQVGRRHGRTMTAFI